MPAPFSVQAVTAPAVAALLKLEKQNAYVQANAVNRTIKRVQQGERENVQRQMTVRRSDFILRQVAVIKPFASATERRFWAKVAVGQKKRLLLSQLETGGTKQPVKGRRVAVPVTGGPARPVFRSQAIEAFTFKALRLVRTVSHGTRERLASPRLTRSRRRRADVSFHRHETTGGKVQWRGAQRTFILEQTARAPQGGVFQRVGPGPDQVRLVYSFARAPRLPASLGFLTTARATADRYFGADLRREVEAAIAHAMGRG